MSAPTTPPASRTFVARRICPTPTAPGRRRAERGFGRYPSAYAGADRPHDVRGARSEGRAETAQEFLQGRRDSDQAIEDRRARLLALPCPAQGNTGCRAGARCDDAMRELGRTAVDDKRVPRFVATYQDAPGARREDR